MVKMRFHSVLISLEVTKVVQSFLNWTDPPNCLYFEKYKNIFKMKFEKLKEEEESWVGEDLYPLEKKMMFLI